MVKFLIYGFVYIAGMASCYFIIELSENKIQHSIDHQSRQVESANITPKNEQAITPAANNSLGLSHAHSLHALAACNASLTIANKKLSLAIPGNTAMDQQRQASERLCDLPQLDEQAREEINKAIAQSYARKSAEGVYSDFFLEEVDEVWAETKQRAIADFLSSNSTLSGVGANNIECRATRCRVVVPAYDEVESTEISELILAEVVDKYQSMGLAQSVTVFPDYSTGELNVYLMRAK